MIPIGTKVSPEARARLTNICLVKGFSEYDALQMMVDVLIRMMDDRFNLSYDMERMIAIFDGVKDWRTSIRLTDSEKAMNISAAFYVMTEPNRTGTRLAYVQGDAQDMLRTCTFNVQDVTDKFVSMLMPDAYNKLKQIAEELGTTNTYDTLLRMIEDHRIDITADEINEMFADNDYAENAKKMAAQPYKRKINKNIHKQLTLDL